MLSQRHYGFCLSYFCWDWLCAGVRFEEKPLSSGCLNANDCVRRFSFYYMDMLSIISSILFAISIGSLSMCVGDIYNDFLVALKMNRHSVLVTSKTNIYYYNEEP